MLSAARVRRSFVQPQQDPAAGRPELSEQIRKQDCERNAAQRWIPDHSDELRPYRPVLLGDDLYCCQSVAALSMPGRMQTQLPQAFIRTAA